MVTPPHHKFKKNAPEWYEEMHERQRKAHASRRIRVEHGIAHLKNWRALARHLGRREHIHGLVRQPPGTESELARAVVLASGVDHSSGRGCSCGPADRVPSSTAITSDTGRLQMSLRRRATVIAFSALLAGTSLTGAASASAPGEAAPAAPTAVASGFNCASPYIRDTENYNGYTAGYSWAWNVEVGINYNNSQYSDRVKEIQCLVNNLWGYDAGAEDGIFGPGTETAIKAFQKDVGLAVDGIVGPNTWRVLRIGYQK
ncbi:peptidoglycan-binding protein [Streptomyces sp. NPDC057148]|uniref:peptidoglycan-binding domain-containing protein n=1 Tax=unclassified Streptomyces TaxID=2593676 RepID=UPI00362ACCA0